MNTLSLNPVKQPLLELTAWIVRGEKRDASGRVVNLYTGTSWGRTEAEARQRHDRLHAADQRIRRATGNPLDGGIDLRGYEFTYTPVPPTH